MVCTAPEAFDEGLERPVVVLISAMFLTAAPFTEEKWPPM